MNFIKSILFANGNQKAENVCANEPDKASPTYGEHYNDASQDDGPDAAGVPAEKADCSSEGTDSETISSSTHLRGYDTDLNVYDDTPARHRSTGDPTGTRDDEVIRQQAIELQECRARLEDERETRMNKESENTVLRSELACMGDALRDQESCVAGLRSTVERVTAELRERTYELTATLRQLSRGTAASAEKIGRLEDDRRASEDTAARLTAELADVRSENGAAVERARSTIDRLERELHGSSAERDELRRRADKQRQDAEDYIVDVVRKLGKLKKEYAELSARAEAVTRETGSVDVWSQTGLPEAPGDLNGIDCSCSAGSIHAKTEEMQALQRELAETKELYENKKHRYQETIAALEKKAAKYKTNWKNKANEYKYDVSIKDRQFAELSEEFKGIVRYKNDIIAFERNSLEEIRKQLNDQKMLFELEKQNAYDGQIRCNDRIKALIEEVTAQNDKVVELTSYIQGLKGQQTKDGRPLKCAKPSRSVVYCGGVVAVKQKLKKKSSTTSSCGLKKKNVDKGHNDMVVEREASERIKNFVNRMCDMNKISR